MEKSELSVGSGAPPGTMSEKDLEANSGRKMSRIGGPVSGVTIDSDDEFRTSVDKQMRLEAGNAIKYRTCSWQKVNP